MLIAGILLLSGVFAVCGCLASGAFSGNTWLWALPLGFAGGVVSLTVLALLFLLIAGLVINMEKPQLKDSRFYRRMLEVYLAAARKVLRIRIDVQGLEVVPAEGRFLLVCNHTHDSDPAILLTVLQGRQLAFISKREVSGYFLVGKIMHKLMCQPINRENDREALKTILKCIQILKDDLVSVAVFPEGYIHPDRKLHHFRHGVFKIAQKANVPVVVCTMLGTKDLFYNILHFKPTDIRLHFLDTISPEDHKGVTTVELSERIYRMMAEDLGPENISREG